MKMRDGNKRGRDGRSGEHVGEQLIQLRRRDGRKFTLVPCTPIGTSNTCCTSIILKITSVFPERPDGVDGFFTDPWP